MHFAEREKTTFMTPNENSYNVMPFKLNNASENYHQMMNKILKDKFGDILEVYMKDMIVKSAKDIDHESHIRVVFIEVRQYNMRLNLEKYIFGVKVSKFFEFYLT